MEEEDYMDEIDEEDLNAFLEATKIIANNTKPVAGEHEKTVKDEKEAEEIATVKINKEEIKHEAEKEEENDTKEEEEDESEEEEDLNAFLEATKIIANNTKPVACEHEKTVKDEKEAEEIATVKINKEEITLEAEKEEENYT